MKTYQSSCKATILTILLSAIMTLTFLPGFAEETKSPTIGAHQFSINGVTLGKNKVPELLKAFGVPREVRSEETEAGPDTAKVYIFEGVEAYTQGGELLNLQCRNPDYATPDGVKVGDSLEATLSTYGKTNVRDRGDRQLIGYSVGETDAALLIHFKFGRVFKIELWLNYT